MRKKIIATAVSLLLFVFVLVSFGVSHTGLFYLPTKIPDKIFDETKNGDLEKWKLIGNISVRNGSISRLGA